MVIWTVSVTLVLGLDNLLLQTVNIDPISFTSNSTRLSSNIMAAFSPQIHQNHVTTRTLFHVLVLFTSLTFSPAVLKNIATTNNGLSIKKQKNTFSDYRLAVSTNPIPVFPKAINKQQHFSITSIIDFSLKKYSLHLYKLDIKIISPCVKNRFNQLCFVA